MKHIALGLLAAVLVSASVGCSSLAIPMVVARRVNDRAVTYHATPGQAEDAVKSVLEEMGGTVKYVQRGPAARKNVAVSVANSMTVHGTWGKLKASDMAPTNFIVDIDTVANHPDQFKIRIGSGSFGKRNIAEIFQQKLSQRLTPVGGTATVTYDGTSTYVVTDTESAPVQEIVVGSHVVENEQVILHTEEDAADTISNSQPTVAQPAATETEIMESARTVESIDIPSTKETEIVLTEEEAIKRGIIPEHVETVKD